MWMVSVKLKDLLSKVSRQTLVLDRTWDYMIIFVIVMHCYVIATAKFGFNF